MSFTVTFLSAVYFGERSLARFIFAPPLQASPLTERGFCCDCGHVGDGLSNEQRGDGGSSLLAARRREHG